MRNCIFLLPAACLLLVTLPVQVFGQNKFSVRTSQMAFISNAELELIEATSREVQGLIDPTTNQFAFIVEVRSFKGFNSELQREHFNEKYLESEKYPRARFSGKIIEAVDYTVDRTYEVRAKGELEIHGQKQTRIIRAVLTVADGIVSLETHFLVPLSDHNISIPTVVNQKIATEIEVNFSATLTRQSL